MKVAPWRAGANENTTISFSTDAFVGNTPIKAGRYGVHLLIESNGTVHWQFSSNSEAWGSYYYDKKDIVASVKTEWQDHDLTERLSYQFDSLKSESAELSLTWGDKRLPISIRVDAKSYYTG